ncbi:DUF1878 family protein [Neobacillus sp. SM06]|uniref:DUF1878 family protein n=1 Tax=Neobacillus sp. SM06 TaxID=3422492 RepID=UPI003D2E6BC7
MNEQDVMHRLRLLEYHQKLLVQLVANPQLDFLKKIVEKGISEQEVEAFFKLCDELTLQMEEQKAEGFLHFYPLYHKFTASLPKNLQADEAVTSCLNQNLYLDLMREFKKYF